MGRRESCHGWGVAHPLTREQEPLASLGEAGSQQLGHQGCDQTPAPTLSSDEQGALAVEDGVFRNRDS